MSQWNKCDKIALVGCGKTGSKIKDLVPDEALTVFSTKNPPTINSLRDHRVIISFLPGEPFLEYIPLFLDSNVPVVTGSTGFNWPKDFNQTLIHRGLTWVWGSNFSLGMNLLHQMIKTLSKAKNLFSELDVHIHEVHHTKKMDAPSGTALKWQEWLGLDCQITSARLGDVVGEHSMRMDTQNESIEIKHHALDRGIFAEGSLWSAKKILSEKNLTKGLLKFEDLAKKELL